MSTGPIEARMRPMTTRRLLPLLAALAFCAAAPAAHGATMANNIASAPTITGAGPHSVSYDTDGATLEGGEPVHYTSDYWRSVWVKWVPTTNANVRVDNCGSPAATGFKYRRASGKEFSPKLQRSIVCSATALRPGASGMA